MKDIAILIPLHKIEDNTFEYLDKAVESVIKNQKHYENALDTYIICTEENSKIILKHFKDNEKDISGVIVNNSDKTDFCSQINFAVNDELIKNKYEHFSILEFDDVYTDKWFKSVKEYYYTNENVSLFLPINVEINDIDGYYQYCNEVIWANSFSKEIGYIDRECLEDFYGFNLTGGVFNLKDFLLVDGFDNSIKVAFNYDLLLRLTDKKLSVYVVPKEGYCHLINRDNSLSKEYYETLTNDEIMEQIAMVKKKNSLK